MIISLRGTNGSGKSTIVHKLLQEYPGGALFSIGRRNPIGYLTKIRPGKAPSAFVVGHYEIQNGGVDTLPNLDGTYELIVAKANLGHDVLYEGKNLSDGPARLIELLHLFDCRVILLTTPLDECVASVRARGHNIKVSTIEKLYTKSVIDTEKLEAAGAKVKRLDRSAAYAQIVRWLKE